MGVISLPKTVTRQRRGCDLNPGPFAPESSTLTTWLPSHPTRRKISHFGDVLPSQSLGVVLGLALASHVAALPIIHKRIIVRQRQGRN